MTETFDQLFCTHCTWGTSAQHRRDGVMESQPFEYSARAGSVPQSKSHDTFRQIEPYMYYHLPADTPNDVLVLEETRANAPKRLLYLPSTSGMQMLALISYRTTDTRNRPGSYFAHALLRGLDSSSPRWTPAECCRMWGAASWVDQDAESWIDQDGDKVEFDLKPIPSLSRFRNGRDAINDVVLKSFLSTPASGRFDDPGNVIPPRWRAKPVSERQELLITTLQGLFQIDLSRRESVVLAVEPSLAALVFYGVFQLLPDEGLAESISFSTFESHADRPVTTLAATTFFDQSKCELPRDYYSRGFVFNTYDGNQSSSRSNSGAVYARTMVKLFANRGGPATRKLLERMKKAGATEISGLEEFAKAEALIPLLEKPDPQQPLSSSLFPENPRARAFLRDELGERLAALPPGAAKTLLEPSTHALCLLQLIAGDERIPRAQAFVDQLLAELPPESLSQLSDFSVHPKHIVTALAPHVQRSQQFPEPQGTYWQPTIVEEMTERLDVDSLSGFVQRTLAARLPDRIKLLCGALLKTCTRSSPKHHILTEFLAHPAVTEGIETLQSPVGRDLRFEWLNSSSLRTGLLELDSTLPDVLSQLLEELPNHKSQFPIHLELLNQCKTRLPASLLPRLAGWNDLKNKLGALAEIQREPPHFLERVHHKRATALKSTGKGVALAANQAMPTGTKPRNELINWLCDLVASQGDLPEGFHHDLDNLFLARPQAVGPMPPAPPVPGTTSQTASQVDSLPPAAVPARSSLGIIGVGVAALLLVGLGIYLGSGLRGNAGPAQNLASVVPVKSPPAKQPIGKKKKSAVRKFDSPDIEAVKPATTDSTTETTTTVAHPQVPVVTETDNVLRVIKFSGGKDEYIKLIGATEKFDVNRDFTIELLVTFADVKSIKTQLLAGNQYRDGFEFHSKDGLEKDKGWALEISQTAGLPKLEFRVAKEDGSWLSISKEIALEAGWNHLAVVRKGQFMTLYGNGKTTGATSHEKTPFTTGTRPVFIGAGPGTIPEGKPLQGELREFQIAQAARYADSFTPPKKFTNDADSVVLLRFDSGPGNVIASWNDAEVAGEIIGATWADLEPETVAVVPSSPPIPPTETESEETGRVKPAYPFRNDRDDQPVAEYFYALPPVPESAEAPPGPPAEPLPNVKNVAHLVLHGFRDLNRRLEEMEGEFSKFRFQSWHNEPEKQLEIYFAKQAEENQKPEGHLLAVLATKKEQVTFQWKFVENETVRKSWQPLLSHFIVETRVNGETEQGIALHEAPERLDPIIVTPPTMVEQTEENKPQSGEKVPLVFNLPDYRFPATFRKGDFSFVLGSGAIQWDEISVPFGIENDRENRRPKQFIKLDGGFGSLHHLDLKLDARKVQIEISPTNKKLKQERDNDLKGPSFLKQSLIDVLNVSKTGNQAQKNNALVKLANALNLKTTSSDLVTGTAERRIQELSEEIKAIEDRYRSGLMDLDAAYARDYPVTVVIYRVVDGDVSIGSNTVVGGWLDPVLVIGKP